MAASSRKKLEIHSWTIAGNHFKSVRFSPQAKCFVVRKHTTLHDEHHHNVHNITAQSNTKSERNDS
jgi:hypothetical protein